MDSEAHRALDRLPIPQDPKVPRDSADAFRDLLEVERLRIEASNRRTAILEKALDLDSQKDKRQFEFASTSRNQRLELIRERDSFPRKLVWAFVAGIGCIALIMFGVYLFGNAEQQEAAATVLRYGFVAAAGGGAFITLSPVVKAFASKS